MSDLLEAILFAFWRIKKKIKTQSLSMFEYKQGFRSNEVRLSNGRAVRLGSNRIVWLLYLQGSYIILMQAKDERIPKVTFTSDAKSNHAVK